MNKPERILVVDDSLTIRRALEFILKPQGYSVEFAADGRESLAKAAEFDPDLVLLDYVLPDMRGPDICAALASMPVTAKTPVILVSAKGASVRQAYQDAQNVVSYITKPFKPQVVQAIVANALARVQSGSALPVAHGERPEPTAAPAPAAAAAPAALAATGAKLLSGSPDEAFALLLDQLEDALSVHDFGERPRLGAALRQLTERVSEVERHLAGDALMPYRLRPDGSFANIMSTLLQAHRALCTAALAIASSLPQDLGIPDLPRLIAACPADHPLHPALVEELAAAPGRGVLVDTEFAQLPALVRLLDPEHVLVASEVMAHPGVGARLSAAMRDRSTTRLIALVRPGAAVSETASHEFFKQIDDPGDLKSMLRGLLLGVAASANGSSPTALEVVSLDG